MRFKKAIPAIVIALVFLSAACKKQEPPKSVEKTQELITESRSYTDPLRQATFRAALEKEGIPFKVTTRPDGREQLEWNGDYSIKVSRIEGELFPDTLLQLRSVHLEPREAKKFIEWLKKQKIPYEIISNRGQEFVVWREADNEKVMRSGLVPKN